MWYGQPSLRDGLTDEQIPSKMVVIESIGVARRTYFDVLPRLELQYFTRRLVENVLRLDLRATATIHIITTECSEPPET